MWHRDANRSASAAIVLRLELPAEVVAAGYGPPKEIFLNATELAPASEGRMIGLDLSWGGKAATRLYEGIYFDVHPPAWDASPARSSLDGQQHNGSMEEASVYTHHSEAQGRATQLLIDKIGSAVDASDVVAHGGSALHGMDPHGGVTFVGPTAPVASERTLDDHRGFASQSSSRRLRVKSLDAGLVLPAAAGNAWNFSAFYEHPAVADDGVSFNLMNNYYMYVHTQQLQIDRLDTCVAASFLHDIVPRCPP
jgi:hypothetical protein